MKTRLLLLAVVGFGGCLAAGAADWPQWRGPNRDGTSSETGLLKEWPKDGPKLLWQLNDLGYDYATPSVAGDHVYVLSSKGGDEFVLALSVKDGKETWSAKVGKVGPNGGMPYPGARSTPTVDGELLYALASAGELACLETASGKERWRKNLRTDFGGQPGMWAYSESPLVDGDTLVCSPGGKAATMVALNKTTGEVIWKSAVPEGDAAAYASPIIVEAGGRKQYVQFLGKGVVGVDAKTGKFLWRYNQTGKGPANIPTPVAHAGFVYSGGGRTGFGGLVRLEASGDEVSAKEVYFERNLPNTIGGAVVVGDYLYGTTSSGLVCVEFATGSVKWKDSTLGAGSVCCVGGMLYVHAENGTVALVEATPDGFHEKGQFSPPEQPRHKRGGMEKSWAYPVVANGRLYIRDLGTLWCYDVSGGREK